MKSVHFLSIDELFQLLRLYKAWGMFELGVNRDPFAPGRLREVMQPYMRGDLDLDPWHHYFQRTQAPFLIILYNIHAYVNREAMITRQARHNTHRPRRDEDWSPRTSVASAGEGAGKSSQCSSFSSSHTDAAGSLLYRLLIIITTIIIIVKTGREKSTSSLLLFFWYRRCCK